MSYEFIDATDGRMIPNYIYLVKNPDDEDFIDVIYGGNKIATIDGFGAVVSLFWGKNKAFLGNYNSLSAAKSAVVTILEMIK